MGLRERFRRDEEQLDDATAADGDVTVGDVAIRVGEEQPEPTYVPASTPPEELAGAAQPDAASEQTIESEPAASAPVAPAIDDSAPAAREALVRPRLAPWQSAALGTKKDIDEDRLFEEAGLGRFERKAAPHLQAPTKIVTTPSPAPAAPSQAIPTPSPVVDEASDASTAATNEAAELDVDLSDGDEDEDSDRALARRASKLLERGDLSPDDPEVIHLLEVVNSSGERARPGELVDLSKLDPSERTRLIIRVLCGLVAELPTDDRPAPEVEIQPEDAAATA
jgi:hypothetical protein